MVAGVECLLERNRIAHRLYRDVNAVTSSQIANGLHCVGVAGVDGVGGAERPGPFQLAVVDVNGDYGVRAGQL